MARKTYNDEFKTAARPVSERGGFHKGGRHQLRRRQGSIRRWARKYAPAVLAHAPDAPVDDLLRENQRLREENRRLLMWREILRKATAFFANELP